jgi:hypothetical protein
MPSIRQKQACPKTQYFTMQVNEGNKTSDWPITQAAPCCRSSSCHQKRQLSSFALEGHADNTHYNAHKPGYLQVPAAAVDANTRTFVGSTALVPHHSLHERQDCCKLHAGQVPAAAHPSCRRHRFVRSCVSCRSTSLRCNCPQQSTRVPKD